MKARFAIAPLFALGAFVAATAVHAEPASYALDPAHTFVTFGVKHFGTSTVRGRFDKKNGTVVLDKAAKAGKIDVTIDMTSINSGVTSFDGHLKSKDFFNVEAHPSATFTSDRLMFEGEKVTAVHGKLTLLGKTQDVTLKSEGFNCYENPRLKREVCGGDFETTIKRSAFGMGYGLPGIPDDVHLTIQVEGIKQ